MTQRGPARPPGETRASDISFNQSEDSLGRKFFSQSQPQQKPRRKSVDVATDSEKTPSDSISHTKIAISLPKIQLATAEESPVKRDFKLKLPAKYEVPRVITQLRNSPTPRTPIPSTTPTRLRPIDNSDQNDPSKSPKKGVWANCNSSADGVEDSDEEFYPSVVNTFCTNHQEINEGM